MIRKYVNEICSVLDIPIPEVILNDANLKDGTMLAACDVESNTLAVKPMEKTNPDMFFAIAHELRHLWQAKNTDYLVNYKSRAECSDTSEYNMQKAEIDANAFAVVVMTDCFGLRPLFEGMDENVKKEIYYHADSLKI